MDQKLLFLINREWTHPALDRFMAVLSSWDTWWPVLIVVILLMAIRGGFRARAFLLVVGIAAGLTDGAVCKPLKSLVDRPRPHQALANVRQVDLAKAKPRLLAIGKPLKVRISKEPQPGADIDGRSLPSSHVANTAAVALVTLVFYGAAGAWMFLVPIFVGYSRIYTGAHWPSDVALSLILGALVGCGTILLARILWRKYGSRLLPGVHAHHPELLS